MNDIEFLQRFISFEERNKLYSFELEGVPIWEIIRRDVFLALQDNIGNVKLGKESHGIKSLFRFLFSFLKSCFLKNPFLIDKNIDLLLFTSSRKKIVNGKYVDIYIDEICEKLDSKYAILEKNFKYNHYNGDLYKKTYFYDLISFPSFIYSKLVNSNKSIDILTDDLNQIIRSEYGEILESLNDILYSKYNLFNLSRILNDRLLNNISPSRIVLYNSYNVFSQSLVFVAKQKGIPVYELQHGTIGKTHNAYNYPEKVVLKTFPDYLLTWGSYHTEDVTLPIPKQNIKEVGFPFLESQITNDIDIKENRIIIISQRRKDIANYTYKIAKNLPGYEIIFKAHPTECHYAKEKYSYLTQLNNIQIIVNDSPSLYELFNRAKFVVGVNSTALIEAIAFNCKVIIMDLPGSDTYSDIVDHVSVLKCKPEEFIFFIKKKINGKDEITDVDFLFKKGAIKNIKQTIEN